MAYPKILKSKSESDTRIMLAYNKNEAARISSEPIDLFGGFNFDTSDAWENITADYLRNTYGKVESKEHAEFIVKLAESAGFKLSSDGVDMSSVNSFMIYGGDKVIDMYTMKAEHLSNDEGYKLITLPLPPKESGSQWMLGDQVECAGQSFGFDGGKFEKITTPKSEKKKCRTIKLLRKSRKIYTKQ